MEMGNQEREADNLGVIVNKTRKEINMAKKRNCRRTTEESMIHAKAVKMRRMTDEQLVHYVEGRAAGAESEGISQKKMPKRDTQPIDLDPIVKEIGQIKGIGAVKLQEITNVLEARLCGSSARTTK